MGKQRKQKQNYQYSHNLVVNIEMEERIRALQMLNQILLQDFQNIIVTEYNRYAS